MEMKVKGVRLRITTSDDRIISYLDVMGGKIRVMYDDKKGILSVKKGEEVLVNYYQTELYNEVANKASKSFQYSVELYEGHLKGTLDLSV